MTIYILILLSQLFSQVNGPLPTTPYYGPGANIVLLDGRVVGRKFEDGDELVMTSPTSIKTGNGTEVVRSIRSKPSLYWIEVEYCPARCYLEWVAASLQVFISAEHRSIKQIWYQAP